MSYELDTLWEKRQENFNTKAISLAAFAKACPMEARKVGEPHVIQIWYDSKLDEHEGAIHHPDSCPRVLAREKWGDESGFHPEARVVDCIATWECENIGFRDAFPDAFQTEKGMRLYWATLTPYRCGGWEYPDEWDIDVQVWPFSRRERFVWWLEHRLGWDAR